MKESWICQLTGRINGIDGRVRTVSRRFDGAGDVRGAALRELRRRRDRGAPWEGDAVQVVTPLGQVVIVPVPYSGENSAGSIFGFPYSGETLLGTCTRGNRR